MIGRFADWFDSRRWFIRYLLNAAGREGLTLKANGERWYAGHAVGRVRGERHG
jgi:hypothetical protein